MGAFRVRARKQQPERSEANAAAAGTSTPASAPSGLASMATALTPPATMRIKHARAPPRSASPLFGAPPVHPGLVRRSRRSARGHRAAAASSRSSPLGTPPVATLLPAQRGRRARAFRRLDGAPAVPAGARFELALVRCGGGSRRRQLGWAAMRRVKRKMAGKACELLALGVPVRNRAWHNKGDIFTDGFRSKTLFRSSVELGQLCHHTCAISSQGEFAPGPTFTIVAADRPEEAVTGKSCTSCWTKIRARINAAIEVRRAAGEDLPPPPKTVVDGPQYFGLRSPAIIAQLEALDPQHDICPVRATAHIAPYNMHSSLTGQN